MTAVFLVAGAGMGGGLWLFVWGVTPAASTAPPRRRRRLGDRWPDWRVRATGAAVAGLVALLVTRWPVAFLAALVLGFFFRDVFFSPAGRAAVDRSVAIASWTEMLRDTLSASSGLEAAIAASAPLSAPVIRPALAALVSRLGREPLADALAEFAEELADPTADLVVSALILGARGEAQNLSELLSALAESARDEATMRLGVQAARSSTQTSVRVVAGVTVGMVAGLLVLNRSYLQPYGSASGQLVLAAVFALFAGGLIWLRQMSRLREPERFLAPKAGSR